MKRQATWGLVGVLAVAGAFGVWLGPGANHGDRGINIIGDARGKQTSAQNADQAADNWVFACADIVEDLRSFLGIDNLPEPRSCHPAAKQNSTKAAGQEPQFNLKFVVATLPDPVHTHLALFFDRMAEVIQDAAQDEQYTYENSWFPWQQTEDTYGGVADQDRAAERHELRENQPGILLFRSASQPATGDQPGRTERKSQDPTLRPFRDGLIVFVVGEDPTRGIHAAQFTNALAWVNELQRLNGNSRSGMAILGPSFSGSFPSLAKLLSAGESGGYFKKARGNVSPLLPVFSGTANNGAAIELFDGTRDALQIAFHSFLQRDETGLKVYCDYVKNQTAAERIAIVSEDETAYGEASNKGGDKVCPGALWLYYPRDISALRAAYQTNSIFNPTALQQPPDTSLGHLPTDLADQEGKEHDTIQSYAGKQTPLSQEAYLLSVVNAMRVRHIQYVILRSTNVLDQIFLTRYLRRAYPDARIVMDGADRLFEREQGASGMSGTMTLSTYPLLEREWQWVTPKSAGGQRLFDSDTSEGTYIAFRLLLHTPALNGNVKDRCNVADPSADSAVSLPAVSPACQSQLADEKKVAIPDYAAPFWTYEDCTEPNGSNCNRFRHAATWLSVLGRDGFWAIAAINEDGNVTKPDVADQPAKSGAANADVPLGLQICLILLAGFSCFHLWCCRRASLTAKPAFLTHFANPGEWRHAVLIFLGSFAVAFLPLMVGWGCGLFDLRASTVAHVRWLRAIVLFECLLALAASIANILRLKELCRFNGKSPNWAKPLRPNVLVPLTLTGWIVGFIIFFAVYAEPLQSFLKPANRFFTYYRSMHILSGVSPIVPLMMLAIGFYLWFWNSLHGLALFGPDRCRLPAESDLRFNDPEHPDHKLGLLRMFSQEQAARYTERAAKPLAWSTIALTFILWAGLLLLMRLLSRSSPLRSLGAAHYGKIVLVCLVGCFSLMMADAWQLLRTWTKLRELLMFLDRTTLRRTLAALRGFSWGTVWGMSGNVLDVRYKLLSRQLESLNHTISALDTVVAQQSSESTRSYIAARSCIGALAKLQASHNGGSGAAVADDYLASLNELRESSEGVLRENLDLARDYIVAQKLGTVPAEPAAAVQQCISALEKIANPRNGNTSTREQDCIEALKNTRHDALEFAKWYSQHYDNRHAGNLELLQHFQISAAETTATLLLKLLLPEWREETNSLVLQETKTSESGVAQQNPPPLSDKQHIRDAEEFVCLPYLGFVQNILGRMRSIVLGMLWLFVATAVAISSYPFDPRQGLSGAMLLMFLLLGAVISYVYAQMHRDPTLSHITNTTPGELGSDFWLKVVGFGIAPLLGLLTTLFPGMTDFILSWLQPGLQSIK